MDKVWVVGDIHGCLKTLMALVDRIPSGDRISLVGDLIARGPDSPGVVQYAMDNRKRIDAIRGNHEVMMLDHCMKTETWQTSGLWFMNGGKSVYQKYRYKHGKSTLTKHLEFISQLPFYRSYDTRDERGRHLLVSHSVAINTDLTYCVESQSLIWGRRMPTHDVSEGKWFNAFGHTPTQYFGPQYEGKPFFQDMIGDVETTKPQEATYVALDTACAYGGPLTAFCWPTFEILQQNNLDIKPRA